VVVEVQPDQRGMTVGSWSLSQKNC
jgi:hypothetical protein